jgi:RNA polymerase sigma-70 factor (ECF subfamily)
MSRFVSLENVAWRPAGAEPTPAREEVRLDASQARALDRFLAGVERRAFRIAQMAVRNTDDAHDVVQNAMLKLAQHYAERPVEEWRPLFYRILYNSIRDQQRRNGVRSRFFGVLSPGRDDDDPTDPMEQVADPGPGPIERLATAEAFEGLERALRRLPARQLEAFCLRCLEGFDVAETAAAMGCSEGSVKTHYFRALQALRAELAEART